MLVQEHVANLLAQGGTNCRINFFILLRHGYPAGTPKALVYLENDEDAHAAYPLADEISRMTAAHTALRTAHARNPLRSVPLVWIRFNCDAFKVDGETVSILRKDRYAALDTLLQPQQSSTLPRPEMSVHYMYYHAGSRRRRCRFPR